jgi:hypothetical protein
MNLFKKSLHVWISLTSFAGFLAGWIFLAQAARQTVNKSTNLAMLQSVVIFPTIQTVDNMLHNLPATQGAALAYKIDPATATPVPQPTLVPLPTPQPQPRVQFFAPPIKTGGS